MASQTKSPTVLANYGPSGTAWTIPAQDALSDSDSAFVEVEIDSDEASKPLMATGFGFSLPDDAEVTGVAVMRERVASAEPIYSVSLNLVVDGAFTGADGSDTLDPWELTATEKTSGSDTNMWGLTSLTVAEVNGTGFGCAIQVQNHGESTATAKLDVIEMTVYYNSASEGMDWHSKDGYYSECDMCGFKFETAELTKQRGILVCPVCYDED